MKADEHKYDDIIHLPHHVSKKYPQMSLLNRAAQFSPFAALTGHEDASQETARLTDSFIELDEDKKGQLDEQLAILLQQDAGQDFLSVQIAAFPTPVFQCGIHNSAKSQKRWQSPSGSGEPFRPSHTEGG